jgi:hypothetical protein
MVPNGFDTTHAESPADNLPIVQQERVAADHRIGEPECSKDLQDDVLD